MLRPGLSAMTLDYNSLLLAIGFAGACLAVTLFITWLSARKEGFMLSWAVGALLIVVSVFAYSYFVQTHEPLTVTAAFALLLGGLTVVFGAAIQFRSGRYPRRVAAVAGAVALVVSLPPFVIGYDGLGFILTNLAAAVLLVATAHEYWIGRAEAPVPIVSLTILYLIAGASFFLCAAVLIGEGRLVIGEAPSNWAEKLNLAVSIGCITGIGAMSLALNQWRLARSHRRDALTDAHTGLLNRRALFDAYGNGPLAEQTAVIVFDLDDFKGINDRYGHAEGDKALARFAEALRAAIRDGDVAARLGGEEFAVVLERVTPGLALLVAERVRTAFEIDAMETDRGPLRCTVSAGIAFASDGQQSFDRVLSQADSALYIAKRNGRNRVVSHGLRLAS